MKYLLAASIGFVIIGLVVVSTLGNAVRAQDDVTPVSTLNPNISSSLLADLQLAEGRVQELRGLQPTRDVVRRVLPPIELGEAAVNATLVTYTPTHAQDDLLFYAAFGFMQHDLDLWATVESLITSQTNGFYDSHAGTLYLLNAESLNPFDSIFYARYYALDLLNQNFNTKALLDSANNVMDSEMALRALIEGDAHLTTFLYADWYIENDPLAAEQLIARAGRPSNNPLERAPSILQRELSFPAQDGFGFVQTLYDETGDWRLVNRAYEHPPLSTEHILHPALYLLYDQPHTVALEPLDSALAEQPETWTLIRDDTLGEFYLREHLLLHLEPDMVDQAAAGWGGDRFWLYASDDQSLMLWKLSWDTENDMQEFNSHYGSFLGRWLGVSGSILPGNNLICWFGETRSVCKMVVGDDVLVVFAPTLELANSLIHSQIDIPSVRILG